jgi:hypothetical protein
VADLQNGSSATQSAGTGVPATEAGKPKKAKAKPVTRTYPRKTIEESLAIAVAIRDNNGGNPWSTAEVAAALKISKNNSNFFYLAASSRDFGFTEGTRDTPTIQLTTRGRSAVYPNVPGERESALQEAFYGVDIFARVVKHYNGNNLPAEPFRSNTLTTTFGLDESLVSEFVDLFERNCEFLGIGSEIVESPSGIGQSAQAANGLETVAVPENGARKRGKGPVCFVAMPFSERDDRHPAGFFEEVLRSVFTPAIVAAGFEVRTAKIQGSDVIQSTIVTELLAADIVLADLTEHNPNVLFELGMRMNADLPVALVRAKGTGAIFDVDHMLRVEDYNPNLWPSTVIKDVESLTAHIKAAWDNKDSTQTYMKILKGN